MRYSPLFLVVFACSDYELNASKYAESPREIGPCIEVFPGSLDFGQVLVGTSSTETVTIANLCTEGDDTVTLDLTLQAISLDGDDAGTFDVAVLETTTLADGEETELAITFTPDAIGEYTVDLLIESDDATDPVNATIVEGEGVDEVTEDTEEGGEDSDEPIADAGADQEIAPLDYALLDGSDSYDPMGNEPLTYKWSFVSTPSGSGVSLSDATSPKPRFMADLAGTYELQLEVTNSVGVSDPTPDTVVVEAVPATSFYVQLTWDTTMDLDLHLLDGSGGIFKDPGDCNYCNLNPNWGDRSDALDDASLDIDAIYGYGPETITIEAPADGSYEILVHFYGEGGATSCSGPCDASEATVDLYVDGTLTKSWTETIKQAGDVWQVGTLDWPDETITTDGTTTTTTRTNCY